MELRPPALKPLVATASATVVAGALIALTGAPAQAATTRYEAETSPAVCTGVVETEWSGYSGGGYCNATNSTSGYAQFTVTAPASGTATVAVRFANGTTTARPATVVVNGSTVTTASFEGTGAWTTWSTKTITVPVTAGSNTVRLTPTTANGLPNVDSLDATTTGDTTTPPAGGAIYASPTGTDSAAGTQSAPTTLTAAISRVTAGGTIYLRGGTYAQSSTVTIPDSADGTAAARTTLAAYPGEKPVLNFSAQSEASTNRGIQLFASYWHINGITVERAGDNGIYIGGSDNIVEKTVTRYNRDTGLQLGRIASTSPASSWPADNLIVSAESHDNADSDGEDADGFAAKLTTGTGNVFRYAVSHHNIDDGWDLYTKTDTGAIGPVTIEDSLSYNNGTLSDGTVNTNGDRNGYKLGGDDIAVDHIVKRSIAFKNGHHGFTYNSNPGSMALSNNLSVDNAERNYSFDAGTSVFSGNTSCRFAVSGSNDKTIGTADSTNQFWTGTNGSRCGSYSGALGWSFASDGKLVVTLGGRTVTL
ncbi:carbohydrate-binding protein [Streptomyces sp. Q6]|uniref:Carbohydrate-binding protein n=1 Tax=Streptomyces citrinus TaxID=3118173 RepID=A0ACD5AEL9_9ACTN